MTSRVRTDSEVREQLEQTYRLHRQGLFALALSITGCRQSAEDAVHSASTRLCARQESPSGNLTNYVFASVRNASIDAVRGRPNSASSESVIEDPVSLVERPMDALLTAERYGILQAALDELSPDDREIVVMKVFGDLTFDALADIIDRPVKTIATRYRRALLKLKEKLRGQI